MKFEQEKLEVKVLGVFSSLYPNKEYKGDDYFITVRRDELVFDLQGIKGDRHQGYETVSGNRFTTLYPKGTKVRNNRQWSAISSNEVIEISRNLGIQNRLTPELLGVNILLEGVDNISQLPSMRYLVLSPYDKFEPRRPEDVTLVIYGQALPCTIAGKALVEPFRDDSLEKEFPKCALGLRATTGWVEKGGIIKPKYNGWILTPKGID